MRRKPSTTLTVTMRTLLGLAVANNNHIKMYGAGLSAMIYTNLQIPGSYALSLYIMLAVRKVGHLKVLVRNTQHLEYPAAGMPNVWNAQL